MRVALLELTPEMFVEFSKACQPGPPRTFDVVENALPLDARVVAVAHNANPLRLNHGTVLLHIVSETFEDVPEGGLMPTLPPVLFKTSRNGE